MSDRETMLLKIAQLQWRIGDLERRLLLAESLGLQLLPVARIAELVAKKTGVSVNEIRSERRSIKESLARHIAMYLAFIYTGLSYPKLGRYFRKDHTSIMHGVKRINQLMELKPEIKKLVEELSEQINRTESLLSQPSPARGNSVSEPDSGSYRESGFVPLLAQSGGSNR